MAFSKRNKFPPEEIRLANIARALSHPARVVILRHLAAIGTRGFYEISKELPLADSTVSQHLTELRKAGLIESIYRPPRIFYKINSDNWKQARRYLKEFSKIKQSDIQ